MKTLMYLIVLAVLVIAGCAKDDTMFEIQDNLELKKANVPIPFKGDFYAAPDLESEPFAVILPDGSTQYIPSRMSVSGTGTHIGKVNAEKSYYEFKKMEFGVNSNGIPVNKNSGTGLLIAANGDLFEYTWWVEQSLIDGDYFGGMEIIPESGTGKFEGCKSSSDIVGGYHSDGIGVWFKTNGYLVYE